MLKLGRYVEKCILFIIKKIGKIQDSRQNDFTILVLSIFATVVCKVRIKYIIYCAVDRQYGT